MPYRRVARRAARRYGLDPRIFERQINQESGFNPGAVSPSGAIGIAQIMPATARGWGVDPRNPRAALDAAAKNMATYVRRYGGYENALRAYNAGPGNIQASKGFSETNAYVQRILGGQDPGGLNRGTPSRGRRGRAQGQLTLPGTSGARAVPQGSEGLVALLSQLGQPKAQVQSAGLQAPGFAAAPAMPAGYQGISSGGGPAPKPDISALLSAIQTPGGDVAGPAATSQMTFPGAGGKVGAQAMQGGRARILPGADRPGVSTKPYVLKFAKEIQSIAGGRVRIGTGTNHDRMTVNGNVSDHWSGNAADVPATGARLIQLGRAALVAAGADPKWARKQTGGLYNIGGAQIIFNTQEGGDHTDHLHFRPPGRR